MAQEVTLLLENPQAPLEDICDFLRETFVHNVNKDYPEKVIELLKHYPHRIENPYYRTFFKRVLRMAAEFGFQEAGAHFTKHSSQAKRGPLHPMTLLSPGVYLARLNLQATSQKREAVEYWMKRRMEQGTFLSAKDYTQIYSVWTIPKDGVVTLPKPEVFLKPIKQPLYATQGTRLDRNLSIYPPDNAFHEAFAGLKVSPFYADRIEYPEFRKNTFIPTYRVLQLIPVNPGSVFLQPKEWGRQYKNYFKK